MLTVTDDGIGIEPELLPYVFDLFEQGKRALDRTQGGLGVGLTLVQRLILLHGGEVQASSAGLGKGAQFRVWLPCLPEAVAEHDADAAAGGRGIAAGDGLPTDPRRRRQRRRRRDHHAAAHALGHVVRSAKDGPQALAFAVEFEPEVVLLDIGLPEMDGYEVARRLRELPQTRKALLIALTGYGQQGDRNKGKAAGFDGHLLKPVDPHALGKMIEA
jgi:CheY-like chemotaxis protein